MTNITSHFTDWLVAQSANFPDIETLLCKYTDFLNDHDYSILRMNFAARTIHPQVKAESYIWVRSEFVDILAQSFVNTTRTAKKSGDAVLFRQGFFQTGGQAYDNSPMALVQTSGRTYRSRIRKNQKEFEYPILEDLSRANATDYIIFPGGYRPKPTMIFSFATDRNRGFSKSQLVALKKMSELLSHFLFGIMREEMISTLMKLYLGKSTGKLVLEGKLSRGDTEKIRSVLWFSDIRDYTGLSSLHPGEHIITMLNEYFDTQAKVIRSYGGEILKLLGDGILAVFPAPEGKELQTRYKAIIAARKAGAELKKLNRRRAARGLFTIHHGIGLHYGEVHYGNIGSEERFDFTVIGPHVNLASRIASLCAELSAEILLSEELAGELSVSLHDHGKQKLKGLPSLHKVFELKRPEKPKVIKDKIP